MASRAATWDEVRRLVGVMGEMNAGIFELAGEGVDRAAGDAGLREYHLRLRDLAVEAGRPITFGVFSRRTAPDVWRKYLALLDETAALGGRMFAQVHSRWLSTLLSFKTQLPFDRLPVWKELRALPLDEQRRKLRESDLRRRLVRASSDRARAAAHRAEARDAELDRVLVFDPSLGPHRSMAEVARERGQDPAKAMIDLRWRRISIYFSCSRSPTRTRTKHLSSCGTRAPSRRSRTPARTSPS